MLAADTALEVWTCIATILDSILDKLTNTLLVDSLEWVAIEALVAEVVTHEGSYVVT